MCVKIPTNDVRCTLLINDAFINGTTWKELESTFCIDEKTLRKEVTAFIQRRPNSKNRLRCFEEKMLQNEKTKGINSEKER